MKSTVWESPYYNFTWYSCKKSLGITGPENPCWIHVSYWKPRGYWVQVWMSNVSDKEIKKTSDFRPSSRDQMENWLYFQLLIFGGKEGDQVSGHWGLFPYCFSEFHINFWLKFQSSLLWPFQGRTTQSLQQRQWFHFCACLIPQKLLLLSSFEKQKFKVCFSVFVLKLHCFILSSKPGILLKGIFWLKRNLFLFFFCLFCQTLFPETPDPSSWLFWELGSASCPDCSRGTKSSRQGHAGWGSCPHPATLVGCWRLAMALSCCWLITSCPCFAFPKGKGAHPCVCPDFQSG